MKITHMNTFLQEMSRRAELEIVERDADKNDGDSSDSNDDLSVDSANSSAAGK